jgi:hypothetical protein
MFANLGRDNWSALRNFGRKRPIFLSCFFAARPDYERKAKQTDVDLCAISEPRTNGHAQDPDLCENSVRGELSRTTNGTQTGEINYLPAHPAAWRRVPVEVSESPAL